MPASKNSSKSSFNNKFKLMAAAITEEICIRPADRSFNISETNIQCWKKEKLAISEASTLRAVAEPRSGMEPSSQTLI